jgi:hypothetical protein
VFNRRARQSTSDAVPRRDRRAVPRLLLGWESRYAVHDPDHADDFFLATRQSACVVHDLSRKGAGLELDDASVNVGDTLVIDLNLTGHRRAPTIRVHGVVRHTTAAGDGDHPVRAGVEFVDVGDLERALLHRLIEDRTRTLGQAC